MAFPHVGIVVPVYNDWLGLQNCLSAIADQTYPAALMHVRVADNGSTDWPEKPAFPLLVEVIRYPRGGVYGARNRAALGWNVDILAFTDADCEPHPDWLASGVEALCFQRSTFNSRFSLLAGRIELVPSSPYSPSAAEQLDQILGFDQSRTVRRAGYGVTANLFVIQSDFECLGGFHRHTRSGGDRDFCQRAIADGFLLYFSAHALVRHPCRDWLGLVNKQRRIVGGRLSLVGSAPTARFIVLFLSIRPLFSESWRVLRYPRLTLSRRTQLLVLVFRLRTAVAIEWLRLQMPGRQGLR